jgi:hypothetical protein
MPKREYSTGGLSLAAPHSLNRSQANVKWIELSAIFAESLIDSPKFDLKEAANGRLFCFG